MLRSLFPAALRSRRRTTAVNFLAAFSFEDWNCGFPFGAISSRGFAGLKKKGPGYRSKYALRSKEEIEQSKRSPFGLHGRPVKHFDELKFYHARNKYGQKETLVDSRRRDIAFFDPVQGGFERDPRSQYENSGSEGEIDDEEAALYADFTDTDDDDIYFGRGRDVDGDYDDDGNELRPKAKKSESAPVAERERFRFGDEETDPDEDDREFDAVFGNRGRKKGAFRRRFQRGRSGPDDDLEGAWEAASSKEERDPSQPDPETGISPGVFRKRFQKTAGDDKSLADKDFSPDEFLKDKELSSDDAADSDWDEEKMIREGDEEIEELNDISDMLRDYDRPRNPGATGRITLEMAEEEKQREMESGEYYESDDVEVAYSEDPERQREIAEEHEENIRRLKSSPGGRKMLKNISQGSEWKKDFPPIGRHVYENALRGSGRDEALGKTRGHDQQSPRHTSPQGARIQVISENHPISGAAPRKNEDSWRTLSSQFEEQTDDADFLSDLKADETERRGRRAQMDFQERRRLRGRPPFGGTGVRHYSTSRTVLRAQEPSAVSLWRDRTVDLTCETKLSRKARCRYDRAVSKAKHLYKYWSAFPSDDEIQSASANIQQKVKIDGNFYVAMTMGRKLIFGVTAPSHTFRGTINVANQFKPNSAPFVKVDLKTFRRMKQRGEIITGGAVLHGALKKAAPGDWTGAMW